MDRISGSMWSCNLCMTLAKSTRHPWTLTPNSSARSIVRTTSATLVSIFEGCIRE